MDSRTGLGVLTIVLVAALAVGFAKSPMKFYGTEITKETLQQGMQKPILWVFYNDAEVNSRNWYDFGARASHVIHIPILNLFYKTIVKANHDFYRIETIGGLQGVAELLGGWKALPNTLQNPKAMVTEPEEDWIRTAVLAKFGGLWVSRSVICLKGFGELPKDRIVAYGQDTVPMYGSSVPGFRCLWSPRAGEPLFVEWEHRCRDRLETQLGGRQFRGDAKSDWVDLTQTYPVEVRYREELGRDPKTNKNLELENLLASGTQGRLPFSVPASAVYIPIPYGDLLDRRFYGWILRLSEEQVLESDLVVSHLLASCLESQTQHLSLQNDFARA